MPKITGRRPSVPEYFMEFVNKSVNLLDEPKQCCPFHSEKTPSFSYNPETGRWSCFGKCHAHGDVVDMHQRIYHLDSRQEAERSLDAIYQVPRMKTLSELSNKKVAISTERVSDEVLYNMALTRANGNPIRQCELDYEMSKYPYERLYIESLINMWDEEDMEV